MKIEEYKFGKIVVNNIEYKNDLKIFKNTVIPNWWRKEGHKLRIEDLPELKERPKKLIVGKGYYGFMKLDNELKNYCLKNNIKIIEEKSKKAVEYFNNEEDKENTLFCIHLTC